MHRPLALGLAPAAGCASFDPRSVEEVPFLERAVGVYFTTRAWNLTTHAIEPDIDEARTYLTEDLATWNEVPNS